MRKQIGILILFFVTNFAALGIGGLLLGDPSSNEWYQSVNKAPWTPPNWVFGAAWSFIMFCFSFYCWQMIRKLSVYERKGFIIAYIAQWILNVSWNPLFFPLHYVLPALIVILLLTMLTGWLLIYGFKKTGWHALWVAPYFVWLLIATSLNAYIWLMN